MKHLELRLNNSSKPESLVFDIPAFLDRLGIDLKTNEGLHRFFNQLWFGGAITPTIIQRDCLLPGTRIVGTARDVDEAFYDMERRLNKLLKDRVLGHRT